MPRKPAPPLPAHPCSNCGDPVLSRKPSTTGEHWCPKRECQTKKAQFYRALRKQPDQSTESARKQLVNDLALRDRVACPSCGLQNALPGWAHRDGVGSETPCFGVGSQGRALGSGGWLDLVHPELVGTVVP